MPDWVQTVAWLLPFRWTFYFPIEALVGDLSDQELLAGLGMQAFWTGVGILDLLARLADTRSAATRRWRMMTPSASRFFTSVSA